MEYKYFSPLESQRGSHKERDPYYYEKNAEWEVFEEANRLGFVFWAWRVDVGRWVAIPYEQWLEVKAAAQPEENEFGLVSP